MLWYGPLTLALLLGLECSAEAEPHRGDDGGDEIMKKVHEEEDEIGFIQTLLIHPNPIASFESEYQTIEVYTSPHFGKVFLLDENLQLTERDAPHYNEMLAHVPMMEYLAVQQPDEGRRINALVIGGTYTCVYLCMCSICICAFKLAGIESFTISCSSQHNPLGIPI